MLDLQFLSHGSPDCPIIRISGTDSGAYSVLHDTISQLADGRICVAAFDRLPGIVPIDGCRVTAISAKWDHGVGESSGNEFEWRLTANTWDNVAGLLEPFCDEQMSSGFQWIVSAGNIKVLVTRNGKW